MSKKQFVPRKDKTHGVVQRDVTAQYEMEMQKRYGFSWKRNMRREIAAEAAKKQLELPMEEPKVII